MRYLNFCCFNIRGSQKMFQILATTGSYCLMSITQELGPPPPKNPLTVISTRPLGCCRNKKNEDVRKNTVLLWWFFCHCSARKSSWTLGGILELKMTSHIVVYISSFTQKLGFNTQNVVSKSRIKKCFSICFLFPGQNSVSKCRCLLPLARCACPSCWCWVCESESTDLQTSIQPESVQTSKSCTIVDQQHPSKWRKKRRNLTIFVNPLYTYSLKPSMFSDGSVCKFGNCLWMLLSTP